MFYDLKPLIIGHALNGTEAMVTFFLWVTDYDQSSEQKLNKVIMINFTLALLLSVGLLQLSGTLHILLSHFIQIGSGRLAAQSMRREIKTERMNISAWFCLCVVGSDPC